MDNPQHIQPVLRRRTDELFFACHITLPFYRHESSRDLFQSGNPWQLLTAGERDLLVSLVEPPQGLTHPQLLFASLIRIVPGLYISTEQARRCIIGFGPTLFNCT